MKINHALSEYHAYISKMISAQINIQITQNKAFRLITNAPFYIKNQNQTVHADLHIYAIVYCIQN